MQGEALPYVDGSICTHISITVERICCALDMQVRLRIGEDDLTHNKTMHSDKT